MKLCLKNEQTGGKQVCLVNHEGLEPNTGMVLVAAAVRSIEGDDKQLARVNELMEETAKAVGAKVDGPYYPQDASLLYLMWAKEYEDMNRSGRVLLQKVMKEKLPLTPLRYEVAVTLKEFWGK